MPRPVPPALAVLALASFAGGCSVLADDPLCGHPSCIAHLEVSRPAEEMILAEGARRVPMFGPVGRNWEVVFAAATASPLVFEEGVLVGWCHAFPAEEELLRDPNHPFRELRGLCIGAGEAEVERRRKRADKVVRFRSEDGEEVQLWSWYGSELMLVLVRDRRWDGLAEAWVLAEEPTLRGYAEGLGDYRARR